MGLFSRKPKMSIEEFCQDFYDRFFHTELKGIDVVSVWFDTAFDTVAKADDRFAKVDRGSFRREITALRVELFGLAWMHYFEAKQKFEYCLKECSFTKKYLQSIGQNEIWDIMPSYNKAIARSVVEMASGERDRRARAASFNWLRMKMYGKLRKERDFDTECIARVLNVTMTEAAWRKQTTLKLLAIQFAKRLDCPRDLNEQAFLNLGMIIVGMYNGAEDAIKSTKISL